MARRRRDSRGRFLRRSTSRRRRTFDPAPPRRRRFSSARARVRRGASRAHGMLRGLIPIWLQKWGSLALGFLFGFVVLSFFSAKVVIATDENAGAGQGYLVRGLYRRPIMADPTQPIFEPYLQNANANATSMLSTQLSSMAPILGPPVGPTDFQKNNSLGWFSRFTRAEFFFGESTAAAVLLFGHKAPIGGAKRYMPVVGVGMVLGTLVNTALQK